MDGKSSQYPDLPLDHEKTSISHSGANVNAPTIFLSHSGRQRNFAEQLFNALKNTNHTAFFDVHSLPKGSPFPDHIREAALNCRLGMVILSEEFLTSKWTMLELEMLVLHKGPKAEVLPLFYKLNSEDLKSSSNFSRWRSAWENIEGGTHVDQWERAVRVLSRFYGEVYQPRTSKITYIERVVSHICILVPCPVPYDISLIQGHQRLAEKIANMFDRAKASCPDESTCMVGLHGVGGLEKTTLCRSMVNYYTSQYLGRSCLIEFPSDGDKSKIMQKCKTILLKVTNLSKGLLLDEVQSFEEVIPLMRGHVKTKDVFLAIDNVCDSSLEEARRLLDVGFSATSKILLTSRSEQVLKDLLMQHTNDKHHVDPLPTPEHEEAFQIFQGSFDVGNLRSLLDRDQIEILLERCRFGGNYHPLALKELAQHAKRVCKLKDVENRKRRSSVVLEEMKDLENRKHHLPLILKEISNADLPIVEKVIRFSYDNLRLIKKHMFLDIALFFDPQVDAKRSLDGKKYSGIYKWMCYVYMELAAFQITTLIGDLALDGLIQIEAGKDGTEKRVRVHDLYLDLAHKEAASSSRFLVTGSGEEVELERVLLKNEDTCFFEEVGNKKCEKLRVVEAFGVTIRSEMHLDCMPSLRVLFLKRVALISEEQRTSRNKMGRTAAPGRVIKLNALVHLQFLWVESCGFVKGITGLDALPNLRHLTIERCPSLKELEGLSGLIRLEVLHIEKCKSLKTMSGPTGAERRPSWLSNSEPEEEERGRFLSPFLQRVEVVECGALEKMPDVGGLTGLQRLVLGENGALEVEVGGVYLSSTLKTLIIYGCKSLREFPSLNECVRLERLVASQLIINDSLSLEKLPNLHSLILEASDRSCSDLFNEQWKHATLLQHLTIARCGSIEKLEVGCLTSSLKFLRVGECRALEEIGDLSALHCLEELEIWECPRLKVVGGLVGISAHLKRLRLEGCGSLEESSLTDVSLLNSMQDTIKQTRKLK